MTAHVRDAGSWKQLVALHAKDAGSWKAVQAGWVRDAGAWKQFYAVSGGGGGGGGRSVSISPSPAIEYFQMQNFNGSGYVSVTVTATPTGFTSPVYSWSRVSGPGAGGAMSCGSPTSATTTIGDTLPVFLVSTETWRCTVSESSDPSLSAYADVVVELFLENLS